MTERPRTLGEFDLIERFFKRKAPSALNVPEDNALNSEANPIALGIGDDCALINPAPGHQLAISTDMLVEGRHFFADVNPEALGHKALAVNLSDLAAMGATPLGFTLALALPNERARDETWLATLARGLFALADAHACPLIGGDTTAGPLNLCITVFGQMPAGQALRRDGARAGDDIWVSGTLGDARLALGALRGEWTLPPDALALARERLERPTPRLALGQALRGIAHSAIDISDGLLGDLGHVLRASRVGAVVNVENASQLIAILQDPAPARPAMVPQMCRTAALAGGDDYELLFTAPPSARDAVLEAGRAAGTPVTRIGRIEATPGLRVVDAKEQPVTGTYRPFDHFG